MDPVTILSKVVAAIYAHNRALHSENGFFLALAIAWLVVGGLAFLLMGCIGDHKLENILAGILMLGLSLHVWWYHRF